MVCIGASILMCLLERLSVIRDMIPPVDVRIRRARSAGVLVRVQSDGRAVCPG
jgi:hypothetical protein